MSRTDFLSDFQEKSSNCKEKTLIFTNLIHCGKVTTNSSVKQYSQLQFYPFIKVLSTRLRIGKFPFTDRANCESEYWTHTKAFQRLLYT